MPSTSRCLSRRTGLRSSSGFLLTRGRSLFSGAGGGGAGFSLGRPFSALGDVAHLFPWSASGVVREAHDSRRAVSSIGDLLVPPVAACRFCLYHDDRRLSDTCHSVLCHLLRRTVMPTVGCLAGKAEVAFNGSFARPNYHKGCSYSSSVGPNVCYGYGVLDYGPLVFGGRRRLRSNAIGNGCNVSHYSGLRGFQSSCIAAFSTGAAPDVSLDGAQQEELVDDATASTDRNLLEDRNVKLLSGSCYLPHPDKEDSGGEDAHFICADEQVIGVADGVGGWADVGVNAGLYSRELMSNSVLAIQEEPDGIIDPLRVLEKAYFSTKAKGSSTACIVALTEKGIHAVNLGDSGFVVIREGRIMFRSPVQQHDFNFTFQLECGNRSDRPSAAQVFTFPVATGDVVVAGTDGLFDNLYNNEVAAVVVQSIRTGLGPQAMAQKIAKLARERAQDKNRQTPFSTAAQDAGFLYSGGKLDDITVVVSCITAGGSLA